MGKLIDTQMCQPMDKPMQWRNKLIHGWIYLYGYIYFYTNVYTDE